MKKFLALALALVMVFALAACGEEPAPPESADPGTTESADPGTTAAGSGSYLNFTPEQEQHVLCGLRLLLVLFSFFFF